MPFKRGQPKMGGRKKGTPNKQTALLKDALDELSVDVPKRLAELLPKLEPSKQADVLLDLMGYLYPKRKALEVPDTPPPEPPADGLNEADDAKLLEIVRSRT
jgi:hypothetical protein